MRAIVDYHDACPSPLHKEDVEHNLQEIDIRSLGNPINDNEMPYRFPVKVCELKAEDETIERKLLEQGLLSLNFKNKSYPIPKVNPDPSRFLFLSDTGLRIKPRNLGLGDVSTGEEPCNAPPIYGIHQCPFSFTETNLTQSQTGNFQGFDEWHLKRLVDDASTKNVDVVIHLGDYLYRQGPCPVNNTDLIDGDRKDCSGVNLPKHGSEEDNAEDVVMNFIPGEYGDNWWGWWSDFFWPFMALLNVAPLIALRGNHEICGM